MKKRPDLKQRLDALRAQVPAEPAPQMKLTLRLDADLHQMLKELARGQGVKLEAYAVAVLGDHVESVLGDGEG